MFSGKFPDCFLCFIKFADDLVGFYLKSGCEWMMKGATKRAWFAICQLASLFGKVSDFCSKKCSFPSGFEEFFMMPQFSPDVIKLVPGYLQVMSEIIPRLLKVFQLI